MEFLLQIYIRRVSYYGVRKIDRDNDGLVNVSDFERYELNSSSVSFAFNTMLLRKASDGILKFNDRIDTNSDGVINIKKDWGNVAKQIEIIR